MKKRIMILAALGLTLMLAGCGGETSPGEAEENAREDEVSGRGTVRRVTRWKRRITIK